MHGPPRQCTPRHFIMNPSKIHILRFLVEAYEGIAVVSTVDREMGLVKISIAPNCEEDVMIILQAESQALELRPVFSSPADHQLSSRPDP